MLVWVDGFCFLLFWLGVGMRVRGAGATIGDCGSLGVCETVIQVSAWDILETHNGINKENLLSTSS